MRRQGVRSPSRVQKDCRLVGLATRLTKKTIPCAVVQLVSSDVVALCGSNPAVDAEHQCNGLCRHQVLFRKRLGLVSLNDCAPPVVTKRFCILHQFFFDQGLEPTLRGNDF